MNSNLPDENLGPLLRGSYQTTPERNPGFRSGVWARIEARRRAPATWSAWLHLNMFRFASLAVATVAIAGFGGGWIATAQANRDHEQLVQRYLASIDPHQKSSVELR